MIKKITVLSVLLLCGCAANSDYQNRLTACRGFEDGRGQAWVQQCMSDDALFGQEVTAMLNEAKPDVLCYFGVGYPSHQGAAQAREIAQRRGINCYKINAELAENIATNASMEGLCAGWNANYGDAVVKDRIRQEVKNRDLDCPAVLSAAAQKQHARAAMIQALTPPPRPVTNMSCSTIGGITNCRGY